MPDRNKPELTWHVGETRDGHPMAELREGDKTICRVYPNADHSKIRMVLPELMGYSQTLISPDTKCIEFARKI